MSDLCPECGMGFKTRLAPGSHANSRGYRYWCGSIYYPDKGGLTTRGKACERIQELEAENQRLHNSLIRVRYWLYGSGSAYKKGEERDRPHHYQSVSAPKIVKRKDGEHPSACSYRIEQIEMVAEITETALSEEYALDQAEATE